MSEVRETGEEPKIEVPEPDITSEETLKPWVERYVNTISNGMKDKSTPEKPLTENQLLDFERQQFYSMLELKGARPDTMIRSVLQQTAQDLYDPKRDTLNKPKVTPATRPSTPQKP